jgi:hypothetical protein
MLHIRPPTSLRARVAKSAAERKLSLNEEVTRRLTESFSSQTGRTLEQIVEGLIRKLEATG